MEKIKTSTGFEVELEDDVFDDMELLENLALVDRGDASALPLVVNALMGENKKRLYDHCKRENGRVSARRVIEEVGEIFSSLNKTGKN